ncbi:MAG: hypothetical protein EOM11_05220 [Erysipelotrichia bacterium]|nr:hypothetical protein [Erysipelotrichia bacterium]
MKGNKCIKRLNQRDMSFLKMMGKVGHIPKQNEEMFITNNRVSTFQNMGWINKVQCDGKEYYATTSEGREAIEEIVNITPYYSTSPKHDEGLYNHYMEMSEKERGSWKTEKQLRNDYYELIERLREEDELYAQQLEKQFEERQISTPDFGYYDDEIEQFIAVEIITNHYTQEIIEAKERFCEVMQIECELEKIN